MAGMPSSRAQTLGQSLAQSSLPRVPMSQERSHALKISGATATLPPAEQKPPRSRRPPLTRVSRIPTHGIGTGSTQSCHGLGQQFQ
jgi:hypothetical protein